MQWYYYTAGKRIETNLEQLRYLADSGMITAETKLETSAGQIITAGKIEGLTFDAPIVDSSETTRVNSPPVTEQLPKYCTKYSKTIAESCNSQANIIEFIAFFLAFLAFLVILGGGVMLFLGLCTPHPNPLAVILCIQGCASIFSGVMLFIVARLICLVSRLLQAWGEYRSKEILRQARDSIALNRFFDENANRSTDSQSLGRQ